MSKTKSRDAAANESSGGGWPRMFDPAPAITRGWIFVGILAGTFAAWGTTAELASTVIASGKFVVESARKSIQHLEGGIVAEILVTNGDLVRRGDPLVRMDTTSARTRLTVVRDQLDSALAERARLVSLRDEMERFEVPEALRARTDEPRVAQIIAAQRALFDAERKARGGQIELLARRGDIIREQIAGLRAQKASKEDQLKLIRKEHAGLKSLFDKGLTPQTRVLALARAASELEGGIGSVVAEIARAEKEIGETDLEIAQLENGYVFRLSDEIKTLDAQVGELTERMNELDDVMRRSTVVAPVDGRILNLAVAAPGAVLAPGADILEIVPASDHLVVQADIRPQDIEQVALGQQARVRLSAFDQKFAPELDGRVSYVSADSLEDSRTGRPFYEIRVSVADLDAADTRGIALSAGMPAEAFILVGSQTVLDYIVSPIISAMKRSMNEK